jgi:hypothetical protein
MIVRRCRVVDWHRPVLGRNLLTGRGPFGRLRSSSLPRQSQARCMPIKKQDNRPRPMGELDELLRSIGQPRLTFGSIPSSGCGFGSAAWWRGTCLAAPLRPQQTALRERSDRRRVGGDRRCYSASQAGRQHKRPVNLREVVNEPIYILSTGREWLRSQRIWRRAAHHWGFRTVPHSDMVCRAVLRPQTALALPHGEANGKQVIRDTPPSQARKDGQAFFGRFPQPTHSIVLILSAYAYQKAVSLVPAPKTRERCVDRLIWGLLPHDTEDPANALRLIMARAETVATNPTFASAFRDRRAIVPIPIYYQRRSVGGSNGLFAVSRTDGEMMGSQASGKQSDGPQARSHAPTASSPANRTRSSYLSTTGCYSCWRKLIGATS